ncbi:hypothetical protein QQP08_002408 [Theobroma cacao]|nr:hypothetical protein QQP08_002408 [Theobroma cacao]
MAFHVACPITWYNIFFFFIHSLFKKKKKKKRALSFF